MVAIRPSVRQWLFSTCCPYSWVFLRIAFGLFAASPDSLYHLDYLESRGEALLEYIERRGLWFGAPYYYFGWLNEPVGNFLASFPEFLDYQDTIVQVTGYMLALGFFPRSAATVSALLNWCTFLVAGSPHFVNHFYMKAMVVTLFAVVPDTTGISVDAALSRLRSYIRGRGTRASPGYTYRVSLHIIRFLICIVYFFGGVNKIQEDWLRGQPFREYLVLGYRDKWMVRWFFDQLGIFNVIHFAMFLSYGGVIFDVVVPFLLIWTTYYPLNLYASHVPHRLVFYGIWASTIFFHVTNAFLLGHIGQFPWMMLCASTAFLQPHWPVAVVRYAYHQLRRLVSIFTSSKVYTIPPPPEDDAWGEGWRLPPPRKGISKGELLIVTPCRKLAYSDHILWNREAGFFGWHMMMTHFDHAKSELELCDPTTNATLSVLPLPKLMKASFASNYMESALWGDISPHLARVFASIVTNDTGPPPRIYGKLIKSLNGRPYQDFLEPNVDLMQIPINGDWSHIRPLNPLPDHMWKEFNPFYVMSLPPILEYHAATYEPHEDD